MPVDPVALKADIVSNIETDTGNDQVDAAQTVWLAVSKALAPYFDAATTGTPNIAGWSVIGRPLNSSGPGVDITASTDGHVLRLSGTTLGFGTLPSASVIFAGTGNVLPKFNGSTIVDSTISDTGAMVTIASPLNVTGAADFDSSVLVNGTLTVDGAVDLNSTLNVDGAATFNGIVDLNSTLNVDGGATLNGNVTIGDTAGDTHVFNGTVDFNHAVNMDSTLTLSAMTSGSILFAGAGGLVSQDNAQLFWDDANNRLGVGTATPEANTKLHVKTGSGGTASIAGTTITTETAGANYVMIKGPSGSDHGILFSNGSSATDGGIIYDNASSTRGLQFRTGGNTSRVCITSTGETIIGDGLFDITKNFGARFEVSATAANSRFLLSSYGTGIQSTMYLYHARGTPGATTALQNTDGVGAFAFTGGTGSGASDFFEGASVIATATENWSLSSNFGTKLDFRTTTNAAGSGGRAIRLTLTHDGSTIIYGRNTNTPSATGRAALELFTGRTSAGGLSTNQSTADIALQFGGASGGFRHWISSNHAAGTTTNNRIQFWINNGATAEVSTGLGTGNVNVLTLRGDSVVHVPVALTVDGTCTLGDTDADTHTINGTVTLVAPAAGNIPGFRSKNTGVTPQWGFGQFDTDTSHRWYYHNGTSWTEKARLSNGAVFTLFAGTTSAAASAAGTLLQIDQADATNNFITLRGTSAKGVLFANATNGADGGVVYDSTSRGLELRTGGNTTRVLINSTGSLLGRSDDSFLSWDDSSNQRVGLTKKAGAIPKFTYGGSSSFTVAQSSANDIAASNTFTDRLVVNNSGQVFIGDTASTSISDNVDVLTIGNTGTGQTSSNALTSLSHSGTFNTTAGALTARSIYITQTAARSAGANNLVSNAIEISVSGAQLNRAIVANTGDVIIGVTSGNFEARRNASFGTVGSETHSLIGKLNLQSAAASSGQVIVADGGGLPTWASLSSISGVTGLGATNHLAKWTSTTDITSITEMVAITGYLQMTFNEVRNVATSDDGTASGYFEKSIVGATGTQTGLWGFCQGSSNTTAAARESRAIVATNNTTKSAGSNTLTNVGLKVSAALGDVNYAIFTETGDNRFNDSSGNASFGGNITVTGTVTASSSVTLNNSSGTTLIKGATTFNSTVSIEGAATIGDGSGDSHTLNGKINFANAPTAGSITFGSANGRIRIGQQIFTSSGTYTPTTGTKAVRVRMVGGGGGGGGAAGGSGARTSGDGGSSGAYFEKWIDPATSVSGGTVTIGAGGSAGSSAGGNGGNGGDTSVVIQGTTYTAKGGTGNAGRAADGYGVAVKPQTGSSVGDFNAGGPGLPGYSGGSGTVVLSGAGGSNPLGCGGATLGDSAGNVGDGYGGGGSGANHNGTTDRAGGAGAAGVVIIEEYA